MSISPKHSSGIYSSAQKQKSASAFSTPSRSINYPNSELDKMSDINSRGNMLETTADFLIQRYSNPKKSPTKLMSQELFTSDNQPKLEKIDELIQKSKDIINRSKNRLQTDAYVKSFVDPYKVSTNNSLQKSQERLKNVTRNPTTIGPINYGQNSQGHRVVTNADGNEGKILYMDGRYYEGQIANGIRHGNGIQYESDGRVMYKGIFVNDEYSGFGSLFNNEVVSDFVSRLYDSDNVSETLDLPSSYKPWLWYEGEFLKGKKHGNGTIIYKDGTKLQARFVDDSPADNLEYWNLKGVAEKYAYSSGSYSKK